MLLAYVEFARGYYTKDGQPNQEFESLKYAMRRLKELFGHSLAAEFGPKDLKLMRQRMIDEGLSRTYINNQTNRIKRIFKWAVSEDLAAPSVHHGLQTVPGLRYGRSAARETAAVRPVADCHVEAVLPFVAPPHFDAHDSSDRPARGIAISAQRYTLKELENRMQDQALL